MSKAFLHIGLPKTGTTSIQYNIIKHRDVLEEHGYAVPVDLNRNYHQRLHLAVTNLEKQMNEIKQRGFKSQKNLREFVYEELSSSSKNGSVLISSERLCLLSETPLDRLKNLFKASGIQEIQVILYVRPQNELLRGMYHTMSINGRVIAQKDIANEFNPIFDYQGVVDRWLTIGAEVQVIRYDSHAVENFFKFLGVPIDGLDFKGTRLNTSLSAQQFAEAMKILAEYKATHGPRARMKVHELVNMVAHIPGDDKIQIEDDVLQSFRALFLEKNRNFCACVGLDEDSLAF